MTFDWTISLGNILTVAGFAGSGVIFVMLMRTDIRLLGQRVGAMESAMKDIAKTQLLFAEERGKNTILEERMSIISRRLDDHISASTRDYSSKG